MNAELKRTIIDLYHISRTALAGGATVPTKHDRLVYVKNELFRSYPELVAGMMHKHVWFDVCDILRQE